MYSVLVLFLSFVLWIASEKTLLHFRQAVQLCTLVLACRLHRYRPATAALGLWTLAMLPQLIALRCSLQQAARRPLAAPITPTRPPRAASPHRSRTARRLFWYLLACAIGAVLVRWLQSLEGVGMMWVFLSAVRRRRPPRGGAREGHRARRCRRSGPAGGASRCCASRCWPVWLCSLWASAARAAACHPSVRGRSWRPP